MYIYLIFFLNSVLEIARNTLESDIVLVIIQVILGLVRVFYDLNFENTFFIIQLKFYMTFLKITHFNKSIAFQQNSRMLYENDRSF